jgi:tetratricopeptide (TPR) repeat protein
MRAICASLLGFALLCPIARAEPGTGTSRFLPGAGPQELRTEGLGAAELAVLGSELGSPDATRRTAASRRLLELRAESLPGVARRLDALLGTPRDPERTREAFQALRHAAGSRRADDDVDLVQGVAGLLVERRDAEARVLAESLLLLRGLERLASPEAGRLIARYASADGGLWRNELRLLRSRAGLRLLPALIELRSHPQSEVRKWAQYGVRVLGMTDPATATELDDPLLLSELVRAYAEPLDFAAMPVLVRLVDHDSPEVRRAARWAVGRFGKNAIWQLRELYEELAGTRAERSWDHERTARELFAVIDRERHDELVSLFDRGMAAFADGRLDDMARAFDMLLARAPDYEARDKLAPGYAALGAHRLSIDALEGAGSAFQRALRLAPDAADARHWRAQLEFAAAELRLSHGLLDLDGYARAQASDPSHEPAAAAIDLLSGARGERERRNKRVAATLAAALLLALAITLWRGQRTNGNAPTETVDA